MISHERLKSMLDYNPHTGVFTWRVTRGKGYKDSQAGHLNKALGYIEIRIDGKHYYAHRLAYFYMNGEWPKDEIDHINHIRKDNRWLNLRPATHAENLRNQVLRKTNTSGVKGVTWIPEAQKWLAKVMVAGRSIDLGRYETKEEANRAYRAGAIKHHGQFASFEEVK